MEYRVEELAREADVRVDTIRFYQTRGLIEPPRREGRIALYDDGHLERLRTIRRLAGRGFSLAVIQRMVAGRLDDDPDGALLAAVAGERAAERTLSRDELARETGIPKVLLSAVRAAGLIEPVQLADGEERYSQADLEMARTGLALLEAGFPLDELLGVAVAHAKHVNEVVDRAIELFDAHVRKADRDGHDDDPQRVAEAFQQLLPQVTRLVAQHFQRTLVTRALKRLERKHQDDALSAALEAVESAHLEVDVGWR